MLILGIESSCDETGASVIQADHGDQKVLIKSNILASSLALHSTSGGIIPENAAREQIKFIIPVIKEALEKANVELSKIDAISVTYGPGLIGSLLVGVETAKTLSFIYKKPLIPTNHLIGHIYANFIKEQNINDKEIKFPAVGLIVSGGHTDLILIKKHGSIKWLGGTRDDAAGEAMDKIGRVLGLPYPGGPHIEIQAKKDNPRTYVFPKPLIDSKDFDFSFSGLKTAVIREIAKTKLEKQKVADISYGVQKAIVDVLAYKTVKAASAFRASSILLGGGVAANNYLRESLAGSIKNKLGDVEFFVPSKSFCMDNGAMIGAAAFFYNQPKDWKKVEADPSLYF